MRALAAFVVAVVLSLGLVSCGGFASHEATATLSGVVLLSPACPVERLDSPCPPKPASEVSVIVLLDGQQRAATTTGNDGRFSLALTAGSYVVRASRTVGPAVSTTQTVTVPSQGSVFVTLTLDSLIR